MRPPGKGDQVRTVPLPKAARDALAAWIDERGREPGPLWTGQRGPLTVSGIVQVVLAVGNATGIPELGGCATPAAPHLRPPVQAFGHNRAELERRLGHANGRYRALCTNPPEDITAGYIEDL